MSASLSSAELEYMEAHPEDDLRPNYIAACAAGLTLAYLAVGLRFLSRCIIRAPLKADDWFLVAAVILLTGYMGCNFLSIAYGMGRHIIYVTNPVGLVQSNLAAEIIYTFTIIPIKASLLCLYTRLFNSRRLDRFCLGLGVFVAAYSTAQGICMVVQCLPIESNWEGGGHCVRTDIMFTVFSSLNIFTDAVLLVLPMGYILRLHMGLGTRVQLVAIFALGGSVCVFSVIRTIYIHATVPTDASWNDAWGGIWSVVELCVGVVCVSLPTMKPLLSAAARRNAARRGPERRGGAPSSSSEPPSSTKFSRSGGGGGGPRDSGGGGGGVNSVRGGRKSRRYPGWASLETWDDPLDLDLEMQEGLAMPGEPLTAASVDVGKSGGAVAGAAAGHEGEEGRVNALPQQPPPLHYHRINTFEDGVGGPADEISMGREPSSSRSR